MTGFYVRCVPAQICWSSIQLRLHQTQLILVLSKILSRMYWSKNESRPLIGFGVEWNVAFKRCLDKLTAQSASSLAELLQSQQGNELSMTIRCSSQRCQVSCSRTSVWSNTTSVHRLCWRINLSMSIPPILDSEPCDRKTKSFLYATSGYIISRAVFKFLDQLFFT